MNAIGRIGAVLCAAAVLMGTWLDAARPAPQSDGSILVADFHVHPFPGDGALTIRQLQREAVRRGLDVIAVTAHNNQVAWRLAGASEGMDSTEVILLPGQEITSPDFHMAAVGISRTVDWNQDARAVIDEVHALGGVVIAAHPVDGSWTPRDAETLSRLDGVEVAHPDRERRPGDASQIDALFAAAQRANPSLAAIGSSDFHMGAPLGRCRTYVFVDERSASGVIRAVREGRTVAEDVHGQLSGPPDLVARVTPDLQARRTSLAPSWLEKACALAALAGLALCSASERRRPA